MTENQLLEYGQQLSRIRSQLRNVSTKLCTQDQVFDTDIISKSVDKLKKKINRGYFSHKDPKIDSGFSKLSCSLMTQKKGSRRHVLTPQEKQTLVYEALVECRKFKEIAKRHKVSIGVVSVLVAKVKN